MQYQVQAPDGTLHVIDGPEGATPDQILAQAKKLIPTTVKQNVSQGPTEEFLAAKPGSPERVAALDSIQQEQKAADREKSVAEAGVNVPLLGKTSLPAATAMAATALPGGPAALASKVPVVGKALSPVMTALSAAGGAVGTGIDEGIRVMAGLEAPSAKEMALRAAKEAAMQGAMQAGGQAVLGSAQKALAPIASQATRRVLPEVEKALSATGERVDAGQTAKGVIDELVQKGKDWVGRRYDVADTFAQADSGALARPTAIRSTISKWEKRIKQGYGGAGDMAELDALKTRLSDPQASPLDAEGKLHFTSLNAIRKDLNRKAYAPSLPGIPSPSTAMMRNLSEAAAQDMERVPSQLVKELASEAREAYTAYEAPFKVDKAKKLAPLLTKSAEDIGAYFEKPGAAQAIRELKSVAELHPEFDTAGRFLEMRQNATRHILDTSRESGGERIDWRKVYDKTRNMGEALDAFHEPGYAADLKALARRMELASAITQHTTKWGALAAGGAALWHHPGLGAAAAAAPIFLGGKAVEALLGSRAGIRLIARGAFPATQQFLGSQAAKVGAGALTRAALNDRSPQQMDAIDQQLPPEAIEQVKVQMPGPNGERPLADIGGQKHVYDPLIAVSARDANVSPQLVKALLSAESGFNPSATSPKGAKGIAQLMPKTATYLKVDNPYDPTEAIPAAAKHLSNLLQHYQGDKEKALAAYNAGPGAVERYGGVPPYKETQDYVRKVLEREKSYGGKAEPPKESAPWPEVARLYTQAKRSGDQGQWKKVRGMINAKLRGRLQTPNLGLQPEDYQRFMPMIVEALKPEDPVSNGMRG